MSACSNDFSFPMTLQCSHHHNSSQSTLDDEDPPAYAQVVESRDLIFSPTITHLEKTDVIGLICLKLIRTDIYFTGILLVFSLMSQITIQHAPLTLCIPLLYLIIGYVGKHGYTNVTFKY
jgi:hypothetical protein